MAQARVLVVDDSPTMRGILSATLSRDPDILVVGEAGDAFEARQAIKELNPDVITLDVEMPNMNGLEFLEKIIRLRPMPVIMVSTLTQQGAAVSLAALEIGAFDCVGKPGFGTEKAFDGLNELVKAAANSNHARPDVIPTTTDVKKASVNDDFQPGNKFVAIGASTGGVEALIEVLSKYPRNCPPTVITQHMPATFTRTFSKRLDKLCEADVCEAYDGAPLESGKVYLAPGGDMHLVVENIASPRCRIISGDPVSGHRPSVDVLFDSVSKLFGQNSVGVLLTGMGKDGSNGLLNIRNAGGTTIGQNERSSVVYGMPRVAYEIGAVEQQLGLNAIAAAILSATTARKNRR